MRAITTEQAHEWVELAVELAEQQTETAGCACATCLTLVALNDTRRESSDPPKPKPRKR
jgi:hypothetical protein